MNSESSFKQCRNCLAGAICVLHGLLCVLLRLQGKQQGDGAPPPAHVVQVPDMNLITIDSNDVSKFPLAPAEKIESAGELNATGSVFPDISREVPVISLANGRVVDIKARLDDNVKKGQLLLKVQSPDITNAFDTYLKAVNDEQFANKAYLAQRICSSMAPFPRPCWSRPRTLKRMPRPT